MVKDNLYEVLKVILKECGETETFGHHKHDALYADRSALITQEVFDEYLKGIPDVNLNLVGVTLTESGTWSDSWGFEAWEDIKGTREVLKPNKQYADFNSLLAHLNAEENDMALEFRDSYLTEFDKVTEEVTIG